MKVVKAAVDFEPHKIITMSDILVEEMSSDQVPTDAATDTALVLGQAYKLGAVKGDILLNTYLRGARDHEFDRGWKARHFGRC